eukprot:IDg11870t1
MTLSIRHQTVLETKRVKRDEISGAQRIQAVAALRSESVVANLSCVSRVSRNRESSPLARLKEVGAGINQVCRGAGRHNAKPDSHHEQLRPRSSSTTPRCASLFLLSAIPRRHALSDPLQSALVASFLKHAASSFAFLRAALGLSCAASTLSCIM